MKLEMTELKIANQDLMDKVRQLTIRNTELLSEGELARVSEMDSKINELIELTAGYKTDYLKAMETSTRLQAEMKAKDSTLANLESGHRGLETILKTTQAMLDLTKEQYSEQLETNTLMRSCLTELYNMVVNPEVTKTDKNGKVVGMTPQVQMQIVQAINRVLNPTSKTVENRHR